MPKTLEPDRQFVERLEWQIASELRRKAALRPARHRIAVPRPVAVAVVLAGIVLAGVAGIKAAEIVRDSWRKRIEVAKAETEVRLEQASLRSRQGLTAKVEEHFALGLVSEGDLLIAKTSQQRTALDLERARLNLAEVRRSGEAPRDEIYAPLVGGRDFVTERLRLDLREAELGLQVLAARAKQLEARRRVGLVPPEQSRSAERDVAARKDRIEEIGQRLELRKRFLGGGISAIQAEVAGRLAGARAGLAAAQSKVKDLEERLARADAQLAVGMVPADEVEALRDGLDIAKAELELASLEVDVLEKVK
ncbi:MAG TPA: hypothetical protein VLN41_00385 [Candidatus Bathyarchaeia archaeon]|nr:hypothetical protein [Candidatus Bathyarchaeia archaeon]